MKHMKHVNTTPTSFTALAKTVAHSRHQPFEVRGGPYERGFQYGTHFKNLLKRVLQSNYRFYTKTAGISKVTLIRRASDYRKQTEKFSSTLGDEIRGMADGGGAETDEMYVLAAMNELYYPSLGDHCTAFAVRDGATADGLTYVGQNNDEEIDPWLGGECVTLTRHVRAEGPSILIYSYAGAPAMMGINSEGLALCVNALHYDKPTTGVPVLCLAREVLNQKSVDDAVDLIGNTKRPYSLNFVLGDTKRVVDVESTPRAIQVMKSDNLVYHTNHFICSKDARIGQQRGVRFHNTRIRCDRMERLLRSTEGRLSLRILESFLRDHGNWPDSICCHLGAREGSGAKVKTFDSMIYIPERREAWLTRGNPCENEFVKYAV
jgi:isopenicillin-N N-acyltransferase-like protein